MNSAPLILTAAFLALPALAVETPSAIPSNFAPERYEALIARSPFTLATPPVAAAPPPDKGFAEGWYVTSLARVDGMDFVSIKARDGGVQFSLFGGEPKEGVSLQKVDWSNSIGRSTVTISKDGQEAKLEFNQAEIAATPQAPVVPANIRQPPPTGGPPRPAVPRPVQPLVQPQGYGVKPATIPNANVPRPGGNILPGNSVLPNTGIPVNNGAGNDGRRRIRVIQNNVTGQ